MAMHLGLTQDVTVTGERGFLPSTRDRPQPNGFCQTLLLPFYVSTKAVAQRGVCHMPPWPINLAKCSTVTLKDEQG